MNPDIVRSQIANLRLTHRELMEDEEAWLLSLESETDVLELFRDVERRRQSAMMLANAISDTVKELMCRQDRFHRREKALRELMLKLMQAGDLRKLELPEATLSIANGKPKVIVTDEDALPDIACQFKRVPDKTKIKELLLTDPFIVAGATLSNAEPHLVVKTR